MAKDNGPLHPEKAEGLIVATSAGIERGPRDVQPEKAEAPIFVTDSGISIEVREVQPENALASIVSISPERTTVESAVQPKNISYKEGGEHAIVAETSNSQDLNAPLAIEVTVAGMVIEIRPEPAKALPSIRVTFSGMVNVVRDVQF
jgi:hypothetical protein